MARLPRGYRIVSEGAKGGEYEMRVVIARWRMAFLLVGAVIRIFRASSKGDDA